MSEATLMCRRCGRPVIANRALYDVFEQMHWLCFHLEFEHSGDPDAPCTDPSCTVWHLEVYRAALEAAGVDPNRVVADAVAARFS